MEWDALVRAYSTLLCEHDYSNAIQLLQESSAEAHNPYRYLLLLANLSGTGNKEQYQAVVRELEEETKKDDWGWQILAYYRGKVSRGTLWGQIKKNYNEQLPSFYFFVGLDFLSKKKPEEAKSYLEKCLETKYDLPWCKDLARIEMEKLKGK